MPALPVTDATWTRCGLRTGLPVLVAITATWCASTDVTLRDIDRLADEAGGRLVVLRLDFDANPLTVRRFAITSVPTILVLEQDRVARRLIGARSLARLREELAEYLDDVPGAQAGPGRTP
jgi:thioredoxin 1